MKESSNLPVKIGNNIPPVAPAIPPIPITDATAYFGNISAMAVGMGSQLFTKDILENQDWEQLKSKVSNILAIASKQSST